MSESEAIDMEDVPYELAGVDRSLESDPGSPRSAETPLDSVEVVLNPMAASEPDDRARDSVVDAGHEDEEVDAAAARCVLRSARVVHGKGKRRRRK